MCQRVHPDVKVCDVDAHGLLAHGRLVGVPGALVVIGEGDDAGADAEDHGGVDLAVGPRLAVARRPCYEKTRERANAGRRKWRSHLILAENLRGHRKK